MQLCMDSFTESSPEIRMQKFIQDLHRILHVDFCKISAEVCLQDFSRNLCIIMMQNFSQSFTKALQAGAPQHYLQNSACINSDAILVGPSMQRKLCKIIAKTPQSLPSDGFSAELCRILNARLRYDNLRATLYAKSK